MEMMKNFTFKIPKFRDIDRNKKTSNIAIDYLLYI